jgi:glucosylceramidase
VKIFGFDHNKDNVKEWADTLFSSNSTSKDYVDGIAFHWYSGACFDNVQSVYDSYPDKTLLPSEACYELTVLDDDATPEEWLVGGTWSKGEGYGYDIIGDLNAGASGWTDWNILLDQEGGPNHVGNFCDAGAIADIASDEKALYLHPQYYYLGHFSKFVQAGSVRVESEVVKNGGDDDDNFESCSWPYGKCDESLLHATTFQDVDGNVVVVAMNCGADDKDFQLEMKGADGVLANTVPANSIQTYVISV